MAVSLIVTSVCQDCHRQVNYWYINTENINLFQYVYYDNLNCLTVVKRIAYYFQWYFFNVLNSLSHFKSDWITDQCGRRRHCDIVAVVLKDGEQQWWREACIKLSLPALFVSLPLTFLLWEEMIPFITHINFIFLNFKLETNVILHCYLQGLSHLFCHTCQVVQLVCNLHGFSVIFQVYGYIEQSKRFFMLYRFFQKLSFRFI